MPFEYLVTPVRLYEYAKTVKGYDLLDFIPTHIKESAATQTAIEWTQYWDEDEGFGSSDFTYMIKEYLDDLIGRSPLKTVFDPYLRIVKTKS